MTHLVMFKDGDNEDVAVERECVIDVQMIAFNRSLITVWRGKTHEVKGTVAEVVEILNAASGVDEDGA